MTNRKEYSAEFGAVPQQPMDEHTTKRERPPSWREREDDRQVIRLRRAAAASLVVLGETWFPWNAQDYEDLICFGFEERSEE